MVTQDNLFSKSINNKSQVNPSTNCTNCCKTSIDAIDVIQARAAEIQFIEESIKKSNKKSMLFQRMPFYKRRRNRNYDKRSNKKFSYRKKDRHFLRTHTYYAKRFFMLKLTSLQTNKNHSNNEVLCDVPSYYLDMSIPFKRRIKSSKYIYKSQDRGFVFDDTFRGISVYSTEEFLLNNFDVDEDHNPHLMPIQIDKILSAVNLEKYNEVQNIDNLFDFVITKEKVYLFGGFISGSSPANLSSHTSIDSAQIAINSLNKYSGNSSKKNEKEDIRLSIPQSKKTLKIPQSDLTTFSVIHDTNYDFYELKKYSTAKVFVDKSGGLFSHKILCSRGETMNILQDLINSNIIVICLEEVHRLATEMNKMTIYDDIRSNIYKSIEQSVNQEIIDKYNRTPPSKKQSYNLNDLFISQDSGFHSVQADPLPDLKNSLTIDDQDTDNTKRQKQVKLDETLDLPKRANIVYGFLTSNSIIRYALFKVVKGSLSAGAFLYDEDKPIGRVIRSSYRFSEGSCTGLCALYNNVDIDINESIEEKSVYYAKNLTQSNYYEIVFTKAFNHV